MSGWPGTSYVAKDSLELVPGTQSRYLYVLSKHSTGRANTPALKPLHFLVTFPELPLPLEALLTSCQFFIPDIVTLG